MVENCGNCKYGAVIPADFTKRVCKGMPPQVVIMPTNSGPQMQFHYPFVSATDCVCALHKPKLSIDTTAGNA